MVTVILIIPDRYENTATSKVHLEINEQRTEVLQ